MNKFEEYLHEIVTFFALDKQHEKDLIEDVVLIREYVLEILKKQNPTLSSFYVKSSTVGIKSSEGNCFDVFIVLKIPKIKASSQFDQMRPGYFNIKKSKYENSFDGRKSFFFDTDGYVNRLLIESILQRTIEQGLSEFGSFIRGHKGEIYELELNKSNEEDQVLLVAYSENEKLEVYFKILVDYEKFRENIIPFPAFPSKSLWLSAVEGVSDGPISVWRDRAFAISTPNMDIEVSQHLYLTMTYRLIRQLLPDIKQVLIKSVFFEEFCIYNRAAQSGKSKLLLGDILIKILRNMDRYFRQCKLPFYWNTKVNMLHSRYKWKRSHDKIKEVLNELMSMKSDSNLSYETVERFFGLHLDSNTIKIDSFGAYKSF